MVAQNFNFAFSFSQNGRLSPHFARRKFFNNPKLRKERITSTPTFQKHLQCLCKNWYLSFFFCQLREECSEEWLLIE